ncbi:hypothetical protein HELRODRAFT_168152 [Helobdella robusta]|uniref:Uncharacterized protein n=1 Tax=Helobdella robusta TaxID=6412 RepID=T1F084_HELRO|nr:hypothetical protein HELRODRAFT_168152 [Helobdella robusta]ESO10261.1 hypothetical protein HELRODRAFT_168152 [Helobdella robusta]
MLQLISEDQCEHKEISHPRCKAAYDRPLLEVEESLNKSERTNLSCFSRGHRLELKNYMHRIGLSDEAACRLCGTKVEDMEHLLTRFKQLTDLRIRYDLKGRLEKLTTPPSIAVKLFIDTFCTLVGNLTGK